MNSRNHGGAGQNVLYLDGHVSWSATVFCGYGSDNIFLSDVNDPLDPWRDVPMHRNDSVLLPREDRM